MKKKLYIGLQLLLIITILNVLIGCDDYRGKESENKAILDAVEDIVKDTTEDTAGIIDTDHNFVYMPLEKRYHMVYCEDDGCDYIEELECTFKDGKCFYCGNVEMAVNVNDKDDFLQKIKGVWCGHLYMCELYDGTDVIYDATPEYIDEIYDHPTRIVDVRKVSDNIYDVDYEYQYEEEGETYIETNTWQYVGLDDFKSIIDIKNGNIDNYYIRVGDDVEDINEFLANNDFLKIYCEKVMPYVSGDDELSGRSFSKAGYSLAFDNGKVTYNDGSSSYNGVYNLAGYKEYYVNISDENIEMLVTISGYDGISITMSNVDDIKHMPLREDE